MRLIRHMETSGVGLFRWRSYVLLAFVPFIFLSLYSGKIINHQVGAFWGDIYQIAAIGLVVLGEALRIFTVGFVPGGTSGRNTEDQVAEVLNTTGIYSLVRNPLYLANCTMYLGVVLFSQNLIIALVLVLVLIPYYERIIATEESFLSAKFGAPYENWVNIVPAFIPRLKGWIAPSMAFSLRSVINREQASILAAVVALYLIALAFHRLGGETGSLAPGWHWALGAAFGMKIVAHFAKHYTTWLQVDGR